MTFIVKPDNIITAASDQHRTVSPPHCHSIRRRVLVKSKCLATLSMLLLAPLLLSGCGQTGPLYLPGSKAPIAVAPVVKEGELDEVEPDQPAAQKTKQPESTPATATETDKEP